MLIKADARHIPLADGSVQCVVTSPPYWGLRKYSGDQERIWTAGGIEFECVHQWETTAPARRRSEEWARGDKQRSCKGSEFNVTPTNTCIHCGAWRGGFGLEPTIEMYVTHSIEILREVRRALRADGVCFWNIGDSYASGGGHSDKSCNQRRGAYNIGTRPEHEFRELRQRNGAGVKPKDLCLIPARVAIAAQADGWWVRSMIIWSKPNPMPESCTDRPTDSYEHILMLTKSARYFCDAEAVKETKAPTTTTDERTNENGKRRERGFPGAPSNGGTNLGGSEGGRNLRNVWNFSTQPYKGAHFATFPEELPRRCILAATSERGACIQCGAPWERVTGDIDRASWNGSTFDGECDLTLRPNTQRRSDKQSELGKRTYTGFNDRWDESEAAGVDSRTIGFRPSCACRGQKGKTKPCVVLDPFGGSGTTGRVAIELGRTPILIDVAYGEGGYSELADARTRNVQRPLALV